MKLSFLFNYLNGEVTSHLLREAIVENVKTWEENQRTGSAVFPYNHHTIEEDLQVFLFKKEHVKRLCHDYLTDQLNEVELQYLALTLVIVVASCDGCKFESESLENSVTYIANPESAGPLSKPFIQEILETEILK